MEAASSLLGSSSHRLGGGVLDMARFVTQRSWQPFSLGFGGGGGGTFNANAL